MEEAVSERRSICSHARATGKFKGRQFFVFCLAPMIQFLPPPSSTLSPSVECVHISQLRVGQRPRCIYVYHCVLCVALPFQSAAQRVTHQQQPIGSLLLAQMLNITLLLLTTVPQITDEARRRQSAARCTGHPTVTSLFGKVGIR